MTWDSSVMRAELADAEKRHRYAEIYGLTVLLEGCIVDSTYRVSDAWTTAVRLSALGERVVEEVLGQKTRVKPNELRLAVWLQFGCGDGLLVDPQTDLDAVRRVISLEMQQQKVLFPYIFGRELHDRAASMYPALTQLDSRRTSTLLKGLPQGVFQAGHSVTGPFGCLYSKQLRNMYPPDEGVPGYYCSDATCFSIHTLGITTGTSAITRARQAVHRRVSDHHAQGSDDHSRQVSEALAAEFRVFGSEPEQLLFETIADALTVDEERHVADALLRAQFREGVSRADLSKILSRALTNPSDFVAQLERPELLQLMMLFEDDAVVAAVDDVVERGLVAIEHYEVRTRRFSRWGDASRRGEVGNYGFRQTSRVSSGLVAQRMLELLHHLYFASGILHPEDLGFLLGAERDANAEALLARAVRELSPERVLRDLVITNRGAAMSAADFLGVSTGRDLGREELLQRLLWKLGVPNSVVFSDLPKVAQARRRLEQASANGDPQEVLRGHISNLFAALEDALQRALEFTTWALTSDHYTTSQGFTYDPAPAPGQLDFIESSAPVEREFRLQANGKNTLAPLGSGFARLAKILRTLVGSEHIRPSEQFPLRCRLTQRSFSFPADLPYLNLTEQSAALVIAAMQSVSQLVQDAVVLKVRNATIHGNNEFPSKQELALAMQRVAECEERLEEHGLYPRVFTLRSTTRDDLGRQETVYASREDQVTLHSPDWAVAPGLPNAGVHLVIMPTSTLGTSGPLRFALQDRPGKDPYWEGWPRRWKVETTYSTGERPSEPAEEFDSLTG